jgi:hypothetical protein
MTSDIYHGNMSYSAEYLGFYTSFTGTEEA